MPANPSRDRWHAVASYGGAALLCLAILTVLLRLWEADLHVPFSYAGDALCVAAGIKGVIENGWYLHNRFLGMPTGMDVHDYPTSDSLHFLVIKLLALLAGDYAATMNLFYLLTFPATTLAALFVMRRFGVAYGPALLASLLYTFLPYHFLRGEKHLFLAAYYPVPLMVMVALWVASGEEFLIRTRDGKRGVTLDLRGGKALAALVICGVMACTGVYYAFFGAFLLVVAGVLASSLGRGPRPLAAAVLLSAVIAYGALANIAPAVLYARTRGPNPQAVVRGRGEADVYGLKVMQLLLPAAGHRLAALARVNALYDRAAPRVNGTRPSVNENSYSALGLVGALGFLGLLGSLLWARRVSGDAVTSLSVLNGASLLLGTVGGFGSLFSFAVYPAIRSYNRISVYIALFSLFAVALFLDGVQRRHVRGRVTRACWHVLLALVALGGALDQTTPRCLPRYRQVRADFQEDHEFVHRIEATLGPGAMVFQLPYVPFPENPPVHKMGDYELFRGYLHSRTLRWSYGAIRGRQGDQWQRQVTRQPVPRMLAVLRQAGFRGLYIDRRGYRDGGAALEGAVSRVLGRPPAESASGRLAFFSLEISARDRVSSGRRTSVSPSR